MTDKEKIRAEIKSCIRSLEACFNGKFPMSQSVKETEQDKGKLIAYKSILSFIDSLQEEPVSIDFEQELYNYFGQVKDFTLGMRIAKRFYDMGRKHQEPVSEELEAEIIRYIGYPQEVDEDVSTTMIRKAARHFANWQKQQDQSTIELAEDHAMLAGMEKMKEQMMKDAVEWLKTHSQFCIGLDYYGEPYVDTPVLVREFKMDMRRKSKIQKLSKEAKEKLLAKQKKEED
jgi:hypothetical protein